jgi:hypothetical protein
MQTLSRTSARIVGEQAVEIVDRRQQDNHTYTNKKNISIQVVYAFLRGK